jgi:hypothetical protein
MAKLVRYGSYLRELGNQQRWIGIRSPGDEARWLRLLREAGTAILTLIAIFVLFEMLILRTPPTGGWRVPAGLAILLGGVVVLREGLRGGLAPFVDTFARALAARSPLAVVLAAGLAIGMFVPFAEPVFGALGAAGANLDPRADPYLHALLRQYPGMLLLVLAFGTGLAIALGMVRVLRGWSLRPLIVATLVPALGLTGHLLFDPDLARVPLFAWDCGALIGGPATAILILAFGNGAAGAAGSGRLPLPGFGLMALATIVPALGVLVCAMILAEMKGAEELIAVSAAAPQGHPLWVLLLGTPLMLGMLVVVLYLFLRFLLERRLPQPKSLIAHLAVCLLGLVLVSIGVRYGLAPLADQVGGRLADLIEPPPEAAAVAANGWPIVADLFLLAAFVAAAVWQAALAEPALAVFSDLADTETQGFLRGTRLARTLAAGAAAGAFIGVLASVAGLQLAWLLLIGWLSALALAAMAGEDVACVAWDGAAMMTGPLTVTVLTAVVVGLAQVPMIQGGFGLPAASLLGAALAVLVDGAGTRFAVRRRDMMRNAGFALS